MSDLPLSKEEQNAISSLKRLAKRWPKSLWLFSASGSLHVMQKDSEGRRKMLARIGTGVDQEYIVETIRGIDNDGGDW